MRARLVRATEQADADREWRMRECAGRRTSHVTLGLNLIRGPVREGTHPDEVRSGGGSDLLW